MKRQAKKTIQSMMGVCSLLFLMGCSNDDNTAKPDPVLPVKPNPEATIVLQSGEVSETAIKFKISSEHATALYYYSAENAVLGSSPDLNVDEIIKKGVAIEANKLHEITLDGLKENTEYFIIAAAKSLDEGKMIKTESLLISTLKKKLEISIAITDVSATHESIKFSITPINAKEATYAVYKATENPTVDEVLKKGTKVENLEGKSTYTIKAEANLDYKIYAAISSEDGETKMVIEEVKTEVAPVEDGIIKFNSLNVDSEDQGWLSVYVLNFENSQWKAGFEIGDLSADLKNLPTGKYHYASWSNEDVAAGAIGRYFIKNVKTGENITDLDAGSIVITKAGTVYTVVIDIARDRGENFKATYVGEVKVSVSPY